MKASFLPGVERARVRTGPMPSEPGDDFGAFFLRRAGIRLKVIASSGHEDIPWDHVSVSTDIRCPTWDEMAWVKDLFFDEEEAVMQFHPPKSSYVNYHPFCLHLWRPHAGDVPLPPSIAVGLVGERHPTIGAGR